MRRAGKQRPNVGVMSAALAVLVLMARQPAASETVRLGCRPRTVQVLPGEPIRIELAAVAASAAAIRVEIPADPLLAVRAIENWPVQQIDEGLTVHRRVVLWQGLEPGSTTIKTMSAEIHGRRYFFPAITITVGDPGP